MTLSYQDLFKVQDMLSEEILNNCQLRCVGSLGQDYRKYFKSVEIY